MDLIATHITRVDVKQDHLAIHLAIMSEEPNETQKDITTPECKNGNNRTQPVVGDERNHPQANILVVAWKKPPSKKPREIIPPAAHSSHQDQRPIRAETRARLVTAIARSRQWLDELVAGTVQNVEQIADREKCSIRQVNRTMTLAFLAPRLIQAAVDGRLPRGIGVAKLRDLPAEWTRQYERLGLAPHF